MSKKWNLAGSAGVMAGLFLTGALAQAQSSAPGTAVAAAAPDTSAGLEEIVVTARKREENLQKAPASIIAVSGADLDALGITDAQELEKVLPSANLRQEGPVVEVFIRGIGARVDLPNLAAGVVYNYNGIPIPRYGTDGLLYDMGSVQQIAGPQGTLYGGSAAGGAINLNTQRPSNDYSGNGFLEGGNYSEGHGFVAQNIGLSDTLSLRAAVDYDRHTGYLSAGLDSLNRLAGRLSLLATPTEDFSALFFASGSNSTGSPDASATQNPPIYPSDPFRLPATGANGQPITSIYSPQSNGTEILGANMQWNAGGGNVFTFIPGYVQVHDHLTFYTGNPYLLPEYDQEKQTSEELRWNNQIGAFNFSAGIFNLHDKTNNFGYSIGLPFAPPPQYWIYVPLNQTSQANRSSAVYAQTIYSVTDRFRITGGVRGSYDKITASGANSVGNAYPDYNYDNSHTRPDWKVGVDYDLAPRVLVYANVQTGYIPFGYNPEPGTTAQITVPESTLLAYSAGIKSRFLDNRFELNSEAFYYDYENFQAVAFVEATQLETVLSAKKATIYGDELTLRSLLTQTTEFDTGITLQKARYNDFSGVGYYYSGNQLADAPSANILAGLQHTFSLASSGDLLFRVTTHFESGHWGDYTNLPGSHQSAYTKTDLMLTYTPPHSSWNVQAFVRNVENSLVFGTLSPPSTPGQPGAGSVEPPRTFGVRVSAKW
jgi:iron complex outermembrane recepter protein